MSIPLTELGCGQEAVAAFSKFLSPWDAHITKCDTDQVIQEYNDLANSYDENSLHQTWGRQMLAFSSNYLVLSPGDRFLDLGCGTGLTGMEVKEFCTKLEGIDLSNSMLEISRKKNVYDKLTQRDIVDYLLKEELDFDYFISADVFVYIGDLSDVFRLIKSRNRSRGRLVFSTEHTDKDGFVLKKTGRYSHSKKYIESLCKKFDYRLSHFEKFDLRKESNNFLTGGLYLLDF